MYKRMHMWGQVELPAGNTLTLVSSPFARRIDFLSRSRLAVTEGQCLGVLVQETKGPPSSVNATEGLNRLPYPIIDMALTLAQP